MMRKRANGVPQAPSTAIQRRIVVAACPNAGGVRLRSALATHPAIHDPGDTGVFDALSQAQRGAHTGLAWATGRAGGAPGSSRRGMPAASGLAMRLRLRTSLWAQVAEPDRLALASGCRNWIEHVDAPAVGMRALQRLVRGVRVVHVIRDGRDVVAAQCERSATARGGACRYADAQRAVAQWNRSLAWHARAFGRPGHLLLLFEDWARDPGRETRRIVRAMGLPDEADDSVDLNAVDPIPSARAERYQLRQLFGSRNRRRIESALDLERYGQLAARLRRYSAVGTLPDGAGVTPIRLMSPAHQDGATGDGEAVASSD